MSAVAGSGFAPAARSAGLAKRLALSSRVAGIAGIAAGIGLALELALFVASGWSPEAFAVPQTAITYLGTGGDTLRAAVFAGLWNLVFATIFFLGMAARLATPAPFRAAAMLCFALLGIGAHALVPVSLWLGVPAVLHTASQSPEAAAAAWSGFSLFLAGAGALGSFFMGLALLAAGGAMLTTRALAPAAGAVAVLGGLAALLSVTALGTPLDALAGAAFMPAIFFAIVFRTWTGIALCKARRQVQTATPLVAASTDDPKELS
jgi:hypothetical protein